MNQSKRERERERAFSTLISASYFVFNEHSSLRFVTNESLVIHVNVSLDERLFVFVTKMSMPLFLLPEIHYCSISFKIFSCHILCARARITLSWKPKSKTRRDPIVLRGLRFVLRDTNHRQSRISVEFLWENGFLKKRQRHVKRRVSFKEQCNKKEYIKSRTE